MKKLVMLTLMSCAALTAVAADVRVDLGDVRVQAPGVSITFGSRDNRGYYWDGHEYRDPKYWREHNGHKGPKFYTGGGRGNGGCPPGHAKKGHC